MITWDWVDIIQTIIIILAFIISVISLTLQFKSETKKNLITIHVTASELDDKQIEFIPFPAGDLDPFPGTKGFIKITVLIRIDNLSERRVSITRINAVPITFDPYDGDMTPFNTWGPGIDTNFNGKFLSKADEEIDLPFSLDSGESLNVVGKIGYPLDEILSESISKNIKAESSLLTLRQIKRIVENQGYTLNRSLVTDKGIEQSKLIYRIIVETSANSRHTFILDLHSSHSNIVNWDLLYPEVETYGKTKNHPRKRLPILRRR